MNRFTTSLTAAAVVLGLTQAGWAADAQRLVTVGGSITEIVYALGEQDRLVARDSTSNFPPAVQDLPNIGYARALSPEGVLSVAPDLIIATEGAGPPETIQVLESAGIALTSVPEDYTAQGVLAKIDAVAAALDAEDAAVPLKAEVKRDLDAAIAQAGELANGTRPKVLFLLSAADGRLIAAGEDSSAAGILALAGAENALTGFKGYKPVTNEAVARAAPEAVLMMTRTGPHAISDDDLFALPELASTPAARDRKVIRMDGVHLLGFGPRTGAAIRELTRALYGDTQG
ncbi:MAG: hemin ABC transporter substrate-binding protein [Paracoccaceae bacterium]